MAQITNKRLGELIQALFRILEKYPDGMKPEMPWRRWLLPSRLQI